MNIGGKLLTEQVNGRLRANRYGKEKKASELSYGKNKV